MKMAVLWICGPGALPFNPRPKSSAHAAHLYSSLSEMATVHRYDSLIEIHTCRSRVGKGDMGANAKRIQCYFEKLKAELAMEGIVSE